MESYRSNRKNIHYNNNNHFNKNMIQNKYNKNRYNRSNNKCKVKYQFMFLVRNKS